MVLRLNLPSKQTIKILILLKSNKKLSILLSNKAG